MLVLAANLGSTSFRFKLLDMEMDGQVVARGAYERIGQAGSQYKSHVDVVDAIVKELPQSPDAIGFKAVHGGPVSGAVRVTDDVITAMEQFADIAPAHNPACIAAMKAFDKKLPDVPQVAAFETAFHQTIPPARQAYAIPEQWTREFGVRRYGFHGASHRFIAERIPELVPDCRRIISCHLGGSSSVCAIENGRSVAISTGFSPQSGLPQNSRCGDFDPFTLLQVLKHGISVEDAMQMLSAESGLLGMSGISGDMRELERAAASGNEKAKLAIDVFVEGLRHYIGASLVALGGCDVLVFTGAVGESSPAIREAACRNLEFAGIMLDRAKNPARGQEVKISKLESTADVWVVPTNEELIVAIQTVAVLNAN